MGRIERDKDGNLSVAIESESDAAQLRATIKASDGADELPVHAGHGATFSSENPFIHRALGNGLLVVSRSDEGRTRLPRTGRADVVLNAL